MWLGECVLLEWPPLLPGAVDGAAVAMGVLVACGLLLVWADNTAGVDAGVVAPEMPVLVPLVTGWLVDLPVAGLPAAGVGAGWVAAATCCEVMLAAWWMKFCAWLTTGSWLHLGW